MKLLLFIAPIMLILLFGCKSLQKKKSAEDYRTGQIALNKIKTDWFMDEYKRYKPDTLRLDSLKSLLNCDIIIFGGEWCGDTKREFPRVVKILRAIQYPDSKIRVILVDRDKKCTNCGNYAPENYAVKLVPTIIILKNGSELGRIVENPSESLEKDLLKIIK